MFPEVRQFLFLSRALTLVPKQETQTLNVRFRATARANAGVKLGHDQSQGQSRAHPPARPQTRVPTDGSQAMAEGSLQRSPQGERSSPHGPTNLSVGSPSPSCAPPTLHRWPWPSCALTPSLLHGLLEGPHLPPPHTPHHLPCLLGCLLLQYLFAVQLLFNISLLIYFCPFPLKYNSCPSPQAAAWSCSELCLPQESPRPSRALYE